MHWGECGRVGNAFPRPPGAKKEICPSFGYEEGPRGVTSPVLEGLGGVILRGTWRGDRWTTICSSALHGGPPPRPPAFNCPLFHTGIRSCTALALHVAVMDSACRHLPLRSRMLLSKHRQRQRPAAGSIPAAAQADARQGLLHGRLCYLKRSVN